VLLVLVGESEGKGGMINICLSAEAENVKKCVPTHLASGTQTHAA
jgi:hypothetical protein